MYILVFVKYNKYFYQKKKKFDETKKKNIFIETKIKIKDKN